MVDEMAGKTESESQEKAKPKKHPHHALTAVAIRNAKPGLHADGGGLYLAVDESGARRWVLRVVVRGKRRHLGLGGLSVTTLAEAREEAARLRRIARKNGDPMAERRRENVVVPTFEEAARRVHEELSPSFNNEKHKAQWITTLETYAFPTLGSRPVDQIESGDVLRILSPIWLEKKETARRVRQRIRTVLNWTKARNYRTGENPVDATSDGLPKVKTKKKHFAALDYRKVPEFLTGLRECNAGTPIKLGFEFLVLTASRTREVLLATWDEIDVDNATWTIPAERMKAGEEHRVPLSPRCLEILRAAKEISDGSKYIFPGRPGLPLSNMVFEMTLRKRMERTDVTPHGFRSSFRDWAEERTSYKRSEIEAALAHTIKDKVEAAYLRTKLFEQRIPLMNDWATFATTVPGARVVKMRRS